MFRGIGKESEDRLPENVCVAGDCFRTDIKARGLCGKCYARAQAGKIPVPALVRKDYPDRPLGVKEERICPTCLKSFPALPHTSKKFCSTTCYGESQRTGVETYCLVCDASMLVIPSRAARGGGKYCSNACYGFASRSKDVSKCNVEDCPTMGSPGRAAAEALGIVELVQGMCPKHYTRWLKHGDPYAVQPRGENLRALDQRGNKHWNWKGDDISYHAAHCRVVSLWGSASKHKCIACNSPAMDWAYDGTDSCEKVGLTPSGHMCAYSSYPEFYMPMCRACHLRRDVALRQVKKKEKVSK